MIWLYRTVLSRQPAADELAVIMKSLEKQRVIYGADSAAADKAIHIGESSPKKVVRLTRRPHGR